MGRPKKIKEIIDYFNMERTTILETKKTKVIANITKWRLVEGETYTCLRKCKVHTTNIIFEIQFSDGTIETYGSIWFK